MQIATQRPYYVNRPTCVSSKRRRSRPYGPDIRRLLAQTDHVLKASYFDVHDRRPFDVHD